MSSSAVPLPQLRKWVYTVTGYAMPPFHDYIEEPQSVWAHRPVRKFEEEVKNWASLVLTGDPIWPYRQHSKRPNHQVIGFSPRDTQDYELNKTNENR